MKVCPFRLVKEYKHEHTKNGDAVIVAEIQQFPKCFTTDCPMWYYNIDTKCWQCKQADALYSSDDGGNYYVQNNNQ